MAIGTSSTCPAAPSMAGIISSTHVEWNLMDSLFLGPLWILFVLLMMLLYKPSSQNVLKELDPIVFVRCKHVLARRPRPVMV